MGNSSPIRTCIRNDDVDGLRHQLQEAGESAPDLINEDYTGDCLCERTRNIQSPLHTCVGKRKPEMVELFLEYGADVTSGGRSGMTPLHYAAKNGDLRVCKMLVKFKADPGVEDHDGQRPVHSAAASVWAESNSQVEVLRYLIEDLGRADDVHHRDVDGRTALHVAAYWGYVGLARYLLEKGADKEARSGKGKTPLEEAVTMRKVAMVELLSEEGRAQGQSDSPTLRLPAKEHIEAENDDYDHTQYSEAFSGLKIAT